MADLLAPLGLGLNATAPLIEELLPSDDVDLDRCKLLGPVALAVQGVMGVIVLGGLVIKRMREKPRRKWKIWLADVSKQVVGQFAVHLSNVAISDLIATNRSDNPCSLYALNILIDTTLGVLLIYFLLQYSTQLMQRHQPEYKTGFYGTPFSFSLWAEQAAVYVACLAVMKLAVLVIFWIAPELEDGMSWGLSWIENEEAQVVIVMLILPLVMNLFQFLMVDSIIRSKDPASPSVLVQNADEESLRRGFLESTSDDEDDETHAERARPPKRGSPQHESARSAVGGDEDEDSKRRGSGGELLFDMDSPIMLRTIPDHLSSKPRIQHAYPPSSEAPNPPHEKGAGDDDGWGENWSASSDLEEDAHEVVSTSPPHPSHPLATTPPTLPSKTTGQQKLRRSPPPTTRSLPNSAPSPALSSTLPLHSPEKDSFADKPKDVYEHEAEEEEDWGFNDSITSPPRIADAILPTALATPPAPRPSSLIDLEEEEHDDGTVNPRGEGGATEQVHEDEDDDDDWGFSVSSPPPPASVPELRVSSPRLLSPTTSSSPKLDSDRIPTGAPALQEQVVQEEEDDNDWGFDDSISATPASPAPLPLPDTSSAVERALDLNEDNLNIGPTVKAPNQVGKELDGLS
ncbi:uncharacterized protein JCM15063_006260 [Sporobolomyces koalae]|uniref:uncharacterized protein n=1 Tax=Sporobolomyces koalae TaxID=500713 RepID=UPI00317B6044